MKLSEIKTKRLILSPMGIKYLQSTHDYASDIETTKYMINLPNDTIEETVEYLKAAQAEWNKAEPEFYEFAILLNHKHIGAVSLYLNQNRTTGEFGWLIHKDYWKQGIATEAAKALLEYSASVLGVHHFIAYCDSENTGSYRVMEKIGMHRVKCYGGRKNKLSNEERKECLYEIIIKQSEEKTFEWIVEPLLHWYGMEARQLPWRENREPYRVWVSEIMLQQTRVEAVIAYFNRFMEKFSDIQTLAEAEEEEVLKLWEGLGYYSRARNLKKAAEIICEKYGGIFPKDYKEILALPGIGKYTAGAISSIAFGMPRAAVDGNVLRVITRLNEMEQDILDERFRKQIGEQLEHIYPQKHCSEFTQSLMELGAVVCVPNGAPKCEVCPLNTGCQAYKNDTWKRYPVKKEKAKRKVIDKTVLILCDEERIALQKRAETGLLAGMWEFPNVDKKMSISEIEIWLREQKIEGINIEKQKDAKHIFTHLEWNMHCYRVECRAKGDKYEWVAMEALNRDIPLPTAFRKCL